MRIIKNFICKKKRDPWQIAAAKYCVENSENGFTLDDLRVYIRDNYSSVGEGHVTQFLEEEIQSPSGRQYNRNARADRWIPTLDLVSKITDYEELKEARKNSKNAFWLSIFAIIISCATLLVTIFPGIVQVAAPDLVQKYGKVK